jgi:hypothetical protein
MQNLGILSVIAFAVQTVFFSGNCVSGELLSKSRHLFERKLRVCFFGDIIHGPS